jgi:hypothetical protein
MSCESDNPPHTAVNALDGSDHWTDLSLIAKSAKKARSFVRQKIPITVLKTTIPVVLSATNDISM